VAAYATFVSADACDAYSDKYPNGFDLRQQGKKWPILVNKKEDVDVVSGMLQGYLECGATRVIKVSNADDDWGIVALNKLAEGNKKRLVEAVLDSIHAGVSRPTSCPKIKLTSVTDPHHYLPLCQHQPRRSIQGTPRSRRQLGRMPCRVWRGSLCDSNWVPSRMSDMLLVSYQVDVYVLFPRTFRSSKASKILRDSGLDGEWSLVVESKELRSVYRKLSQEMPLCCGGSVSYQVKLRETNR
jgi:hypothetical protein